MKMLRWAMILLGLLSAFVFWQSPVFAEPLSARDVWVDSAFQTDSGPFSGLLPPTHGEETPHKPMDQACVISDECIDPGLFEGWTAEV